MVTSLDFLYAIAALCLVVITVCLVFLTVQLIQVLHNLEQMSEDVRTITAVAERIAQTVSPGILSVARQTNHLEKKVASFLKKKVDQLTKE
jgi:uncharacterized protein YoxC